MVLHSQGIEINDYGMCVSWLPPVPLSLTSIPCGSIEALSKEIVHYHNEIFEKG